MVSGSSSVPVSQEIKGQKVSFTINEETLVLKVSHSSTVTLIFNYPTPFLVPGPDEARNTSVAVRRTPRRPSVRLDSFGGNGRDDGHVGKKGHCLLYLTFTRDRNSSNTRFLLVSSSRQDITSREEIM